MDVGDGRQSGDLRAPLGEEEAWSVFQSSERFMRGELLREARRRQKQAAELADPQPIAEAGDEAKVDLDASKRSAIDWMAKYGIRMSFDPMCPRATRTLTVLTSGSATGN